MENASLKKQNGKEKEQESGSIEKPMENWILHYIANDRQLQLAGLLLDN